MTVADIDIAHGALVQWEAPYQASVMTTIFLVENGGDEYSFYMNRTGIFVGYADRGLCAINERVIYNLRDEWQDPAAFADVDEAMAMAREVWDWRFDRAQKLGKSYSDSLIDAYSGWSVYAHKDDDTAQGAALRARWSQMRPRAVAAVKEATA